MSQGKDGESLKPESYRGYFIQFEKFVYDYMGPNQHRGIFAKIYKDNKQVATATTNGSKASLFKDLKKQIDKRIEAGE